MKQGFAVIFASVVVLTFAALFPLRQAVAANAPASKAGRCMERAREFPDMGAAQAQQWIKQGGGVAARLCLATAQFHQGEYAAAAKLFAALANERKGAGSRRQVASWYAQAGLAAMRAGDHSLAEQAYTAALKAEPQDPDIWLDRATERASIQHYWDALEDVNRALQMMPDMPEALRLRGQIHAQLAQDATAKQDLSRAAAVEEGERSLQPQTNAQKSDGAKDKAQQGR